VDRDIDLITARKQIANAITDLLMGCTSTRDLSRQNLRFREANGGNGSVPALR